MPQLAWGLDTGAGGAALLGPLIEELDAGEGPGARHYRAVAEQGGQR